VNELPKNAVPTKQPHLIFISDDEHRYDWTGFDGGPVRTPNLEALSRRGVRYTRCYSPNPLCMPARCMLHNGLYSHQCGQMNNIGSWPDLPTLPQALQRAGYRTAAIGKLHHDEAIPKRLFRLPCGL
jgi:arylsulfatase